MQIGENLGRALAVSLLLHFLLLWPSVPERRVEEPTAPLTASLLQPVVTPEPAVAPPRRTERHQEPVPARTAVAPSATPVLAAPVSASNAAPLTAEALPRSENRPAPAVAAEAPPTRPVSSGVDGSAEGMRQYRLALAVEARRYKRYPPRALDAGIGGTTEVRIEVAEGRAAAVTLGRSSGDETLDTAALEMMRKAAPRAAVPEVLRQRVFSVSLPIVFNPAGE